MNIETELIHKWRIGDGELSGSGSLRDIQTLCNECDKLRKSNDSLLAERDELRRVLWEMVGDGECYCADNVANKRTCGWCQARSVLSKGGLHE